MRHASLLAAAFLAATCQGQNAAAPSPPPAPVATPVVAVAAPPRAVLDDADVGLPRTAGTDTLTAAELAASAPDEVLALGEFSRWGWASGARRSWASGARGVDTLVVLSDRPEGAQRAYAYLASAAGAAPLAAGPCPPAITGLDECTAGAGGGRQVFAGRLGSEVFEVDARGFDATALAARQAARLRAT